MGSFTVNLFGTSSTLRSDFFPEITLDPDAQYSCGLLEFSSYNTIPNIVQGKNSDFTFKYRNTSESENGVIEEKTVSLPTGVYEIEDIVSYLRGVLQSYEISLSHQVNLPTSQIALRFEPEIEWTGGSLLNILGFYIGSADTFGIQTTYKFQSERWHWSDHSVKIANVNIIRIECDLVSSSYINGKNSHTLYQFSYGKTEPGHKFIEVPQHVIYLPITERQLRSIQISVLDQHGELIDFRNEEISCCIHIKKHGEN